MKRDTVLGASGARGDKGEGNASEKRDAPPYFCVPFRRPKLPRCTRTWLKFKVHILEHKVRFKQFYSIFST